MSINKNDAVNSPQHYNMFPIETITLIRLSLTDEEFKGYLKGNIIKYRLRAGWKDYNKRQEDLEKSNWYQDRLMSLDNIK